MSPTQPLGTMIGGAAGGLIGGALGYWGGSSAGRSLFGGGD
jgi:hypothetical protein